MSERGPGVAVIGAGYWGRNLIRNFSELGALRAVCDHAPAPELVLPAGVALHQEVPAVLADPAIDACVVALPPAEHHAVASAALRAGRDVYVEKPLCPELAQGRELVALAAATERMLVCGHLLRYQPQIEYLVDLVQRGELGRPRRITARRLNLGAIYTERNALWNFGPHDCSLVLALAGDRVPRRVRAIGQSFTDHGGADAVTCHLDFDDDLQATIELGWMHPVKEQRLTVAASEGLAVFDDCLEWERKLSLLPSPGPGVDGRHLPQDRRRPRYPEIASDEPLRRACAAFLESCRSRRPARTDAREALRVLAVLDAAQASLERDGDTVPVEAIDSARLA